jgi:multicomponent Na+:H+ antiporter subunit E
VTRALSLPTLLWLVVVWLALWGTLDPVTAVFGVVVAVGVLVLFPLPRVWTSGLFPRPRPLIGLLGWVLSDLVVSGVRVARDMIVHGPRVRAAVIAVPILFDEDRLIALTANVLSLGPGRFVIQIDRERLVFYVYALGVRTHEEVLRTHDEVVDLQQSVTRAFGSATVLADIGDRCARARRAAEETS